MNINTNNVKITRFIQYVKSMEKATIPDYEIINLLNENVIISPTYQ